MSEWRFGNAGRQGPYPEHFPNTAATTKGGGHDVVPYGEGITDFKSLLEQLRSKSYRGYLLIEMAWAEPKEPVLENLRKGRDLFQPYARL